MTITAIILTLNEERHIERCLKSIINVADHMLVVDSGSTDQTVEIAKKIGANVLFNKWINYSTQFNWAIDNVPDETQWIIRIDADEYFMEETINSLRGLVQGAGEKIQGFTLRRRLYFMGRWMKNGSIYPRRMLRVWRKGCGRCEERWMDEHIVVSGRCLDLDLDFIDNNGNNLSWWLKKHISYAQREAIDECLRREHESGSDDHELSGQSARYRKLKDSFYSAVPLGIRPILYFLYRYIFRLAFLDGLRGFYFTLFHALWYRLLVDALIYEASRSKASEQLTSDYLIRMHQFGK